MNEPEVLTSFWPFKDGLVDSFPSPLAFFSFICGVVEEKLRNEGLEATGQFMKISLTERRDGFSPYTRYARVDIEARKKES